LEKYEAMAESGVFTKRDRLQLIERLLVAKKIKHSLHATSCELCREAFERIVPPGWHLRTDRPLRIPSRASVPEPDLNSLSRFWVSLCQFLLLDQVLHGWLGQNAPGWLGQNAPGDRSLARV
jgi:Putative restriction endonuclease